MPRALPFVALVALSIVSPFACRASLDTSSSAEPSVDNARRAVDLRKAPPGGSESVVNEREALLARFREKNGDAAASSDASETQMASAEPDADLVLPVAVMLPEDCGYSDRTAPYGPVKEGVRVVLGRHRDWQGNDNWASDMQMYVGREAVVRSLEGVDGVGCAIVRVDIDQGSWVWRVRDMSLPGVPSGAMAGEGGKKPDPVVEARKKKTAKYVRSGDAAFAVTLMYEHLGPGDDDSESKPRERIFLASDPPAFDPKLGLYVVYARESGGKGWLMLGLGRFEPGIYHGGEHSAAVTLAFYEGDSWEPDAPKTAWSLNPKSRVDLAVDPGQSSGHVELSFLGSLRDNDASGYTKVSGGFAVTRVPSPPVTGN